MKNLKLLLIPLIALGLFAFASKPALALDLWPFDNLWNAVKCAADIDCTVRAASTSAGNFIVYNTVGKDFEDLKALDIEAMKQGEWNKGLASAMGKVGGLAYSSPPASVKEYVRSELADNLLNNSAHAQTVGATVLSPVQDAWTLMRNLAYGFFAIIMVAIGFMIIFQQQLPTRTVVTFTYALPKILLGLVLITFSYPIIALIIDVGIVFLSAVVFQVFGDPLQIAAAAEKGKLSEGVAAVFSSAHISTLGSFLEGIANLGLSALPALGLTIVFFLIFIVVLGFTIVRLLISYTWLLIYTVFSPLIFLAGTLPGQEGSIINFLKSVLSKTLAFPAIFFLTMLGAFVALNAQTQVPQDFFSENFGDVLTGQFTASWGSLMGLVILTAAIIVPGKIDQALGVGGKRK